MMKTQHRIQMEDFKQILNREIALYSTIEGYLDRKKSIIIDGDLDALAKLDAQLEEMTLKARELEKERLTLMVEMGREGDTLKTFIESLEKGEDSQILEKSRTSLIEVTQNIRHLSRTNRDLLHQSIRFIEQSVEVIASILSPTGASYSRQAAGGPPSAGEPTKFNISTVVREA